MRRFLFISLVIALAALVAARSSLLPEESVEASAYDPGYGFNMLELGAPAAGETAGSAMLAEMNEYFFSRTPTAKSAVTGAFRGKNLILICADSWSPDPTNRRLNPALSRLWREGARMSNVYRPDWYQGQEGREFALLSGLMPVRVDDKTALTWIGEQNTFLPFALARRLREGGYDTLAYIRSESHRPAYEVLGFSAVSVTDGAAEAAAAAAGEDRPAGRRFFAFYLWTDPDCEAALSLLLDALADSGHREDTALCLLTAGREPDRAQLFLWAEGMQAPTAGIPCSELDVTPTLLNLLGLSFDSRFLSGRDIFAENSAPGEASAAMPLVSLHGSAYSDWISDAGFYSAAESVFLPEGACFKSAEETVRYAQTVCGMVYDRYVFARRALEYNYFQLALAP
ncbi:MAG: hypothetical protein IKD79_02040 [Oscillospiraceae bacterium]|nr:hypothetical protein [Oscillospiraceae bacterium]